MCIECSLHVVILIFVLLSARFLITETDVNNTPGDLSIQARLTLWGGEWKDLPADLKHHNLTDWPMVADIASHVWTTQNDLHNKSTHSQNDVVVLIFDNEVRSILGALVYIVSSYQPRTSVLTYRLEDISQNITLENSLNYLGNINQINSVFLLTGNESSSSALYLLDYVSLNVIFKWTSLIHTAEWTIVTTNLNGLDTLASVAARTVDFMTLIAVRPGQSVTIAQKSRKQNLTTVSSWNWFGHSTGTAGRVCTTRDSFIESIKRRIDLLYKRGQLRANAGRYLQSQKSVLDGLNVPVSLFVPEDKRVYHNLDTMKLDGYCIALLQLFASSMGFTYDYRMVADGGFYGAVEDDGITGIIGHLARREAAFSPMPLSMIRSRAGHIDFIPVPLTIGISSFVYKLPGKDIDTTYAYIFDFNFLLLCLGPALVACFIGALLHVTTNSCTLAVPRTFAFQHFRRLTTFPEHICLKAATPANQSSRVLTASWSVMCFVCVSAYSAYLTSTFTVTSPELTIKTFKDLLEAKDYEFGLHQSLSAVTTILKNSDDASPRSIFWDLLVTKNRTDPRVLNGDTVYHYKRVQAGRYVFIAPASFSPNGSQFPWDIRIYEVDDLPIIHWDFICLPKNTFYKKHFYNFMLAIQDSKITLYLKNKYQVPTKNNNKKVTLENTPIQLARFELSVYVVLCGVGVSVVCLMMEMVCHRCGVVSV